MLEPVHGPSETDQILDWFTLIRSVYELAGASPSSSAEQSVTWESVLSNAVAFFGVDELECRLGSPPSPSPPGELVFVLPGAPATPGNGAGALPSGSRHRLLEASGAYLRVRAGSTTGAATTLLPRLERFVGHVARSMQLRASIEAAELSLEALYAALDRQGLAVVLCDAFGRPRFYNRSALSLRDRYPELEPHGENGKRDEGPLALLFQRFEQEVQRGRGGVVRAHTHALVLTLVPLVSQTMTAVFGLNGPSAGVLVQERAVRDGRADSNQTGLPDVPAALGRRLQEGWGLTPAETALSAALCAGLSVARYASLLRRSPLTLRKQLKAVCRKLGVRDQKSLVLKVWQEQMADWLGTVALAPPSSDVSTRPMLVYPQPAKTALGGEPARALFAEDGRARR